MNETANIAGISADLDQLEAFFPELKQSAYIGKTDIADYYNRSFWGYSLFHSWEGAVHMALSCDGGVSKDDYLGQAREVAAFIEGIAETGPRSVLEVGCGRGFNLAYLAERFQDVGFQGVDFSESHVAAARRKLRTLENANAEFGDFHALSRFPDGRFSLIYAVEALCHAQDFGVVLAELDRVLAEDGQLIVFDGFRDRTEEQAPAMMKAVEYTERAMAVPIFAHVDDFARLAVERGFDVEETVDRSADVLPNMKKLARRSRRFFRRPLLSRAIRLLAPRDLTRNSVAGLLMAVTFGARALSYRRFVLRKRARARA